MVGSLGFLHAIGDFGSGHVVIRRWRGERASERKLFNKSGFGVSNCDIRQ